MPASALENRRLQCNNDCNCVILRVSPTPPRRVNWMSAPAMTPLRWYFAIDASGSTGPVGDHARLAVLSARMVGGLDPRLLYHSAEHVT
jgi:hypothetical protein